MRYFSLFTLVGILLGSAGLLQPTTAEATGCPCTIWSTSTTPSIAGSNPDSHELGLQFQAEQTGFIRGLRYYKAEANTGVHTASLWSSTGELLASAEFTNETASGWQEANFGTAVPISANVTYVASYFSDHGPFALDQGYFNAGPEIVSPLKAIKGVYRVGTTGFPSSTYNNTNYWVDPIFVETQTTPAAVEGATLFPEDHTPTTFSGGSYELGTRFRSSQSGYIQSLRFYKHPQDTGIHVGSLWAENGTLLGRVTFWNETESGWQEARLPNSVAINAHQDYIVSYHSDTGSTIQGGYFNKSRFRAPLYAPAQGVSGGNGLYGTTAGQMPTNGTGYSYSVDAIVGSTALEPIAPESEGNASSIWETLAFTPTMSSDNQAIELGVKFQSARDGYIQGIRYYKGTTNTGEHLGNLWAADGTLLASAIFEHESESGWQEVVFAQSVPISANVTYTASYHTNTGHAAQTTGYFQSFPAVNAPLRTAQTGTSYAAGVYRYGASGYPTSTYAQGNYWVDVIFADAPAQEAAPIFKETIFADTAQPAGINSNSQYVQVGVKVRANRDGIIHGMHYYNGDTTTNSHTATLWTKSGTVLASQQFTNSTTPGWEYIYFTEPVSITANTTYVMSYDTTRPVPFTGGGMSIPPPSNSLGIRVLADGEDGGNSVYNYGTGFPTATYNANYWVDVMFSSVADQTVISSADMTDITNTPLGQEKLAAALTNWSETQGITVDAELYGVLQYGSGQNLGSVVSPISSTFNVTLTHHLDGSFTSGINAPVPSISIQGPSSNEQPWWNEIFRTQCWWMEDKTAWGQTCLKIQFLENDGFETVDYLQITQYASFEAKGVWGLKKAYNTTGQLPDEVVDGSKVFQNVSIIDWNPKSDTTLSCSTPFELGVTYQAIPISVAITSCGVLEPSFQSSVKNNKGVWMKTKWSSGIIWNLVPWPSYAMEANGHGFVLEIPAKPNKRPYVPLWIDMGITVM